MAGLKDPKAKAEGEPHVEVVDDPKPVDEPTVTIDLDSSKTTTKQEPQATKHDDERFVKLERRMEYQARQFEKGLRQMNELVQNFSAPRSVQTQTRTGTSNPDDTDDLDKIAEQDWKKAVDILAERRAKKILEEHEEAKKKQAEVANTQNELAMSKARVLKECPEIEEEGSPEAIAYIGVLNEDPKLLTNPRGPELAMYRMRERLKSEPKRETVTDIDKEVQRRTRVSSAYVAPGVKPTSNQITLTKSEKEFCDSHHIPYEQYAKVKTYDSARLKEGVEVE